MTSAGRFDARKPSVDRRPFKRRERSLSAGLSLATTAEISSRMARVRQRDTALELLARRHAWRLGLRFTTANRDLPGSPDLANRSRKVAVFCMGCFWHHHKGCARATIPKSNREFWRRKFARNRARDDAAMKALADLGYRVAVIWECEAAREGEIEAALSRLIGPLRTSSSAGT